MYRIFPSETDRIKLLSKFETSYIISLVAAIGGGNKTKDMFVVSTLLVENVALSGVVYLSYAVMSFVLLTRCNRSNAWIDLQEHSTSIRSWRA